MSTSRFGVAFKGGRLQRRRGERGQILVLFEITLIVVLVFAALVIDLGFLRNDRQNLVNAVDAGALAGGTVLPVTGSAEADNAKALIKETIEATFPALTPSDYTIEFKCVVPANAAGNGPDLVYIPSSCDPRLSLLQSATADVSGLFDKFVGAGPHRYSSCDPSAGDKCNVVVVTADKTTKFNLGPIIGVNQGQTGSISSAACVGTGCGEVGPPTPVDLVIILDRTGSMADGSNRVGAKIQSLRAAADAVLEVYDPSTQRVALGLTGPGEVNAEGKSFYDSCPSAGVSGYGVADDSNFAPNASLALTGSTTLGPTTNFLSTTLSVSPSPLSRTATTITPASKTGFPTTYPFTIQIDNEQMSVTASPSGTTWTVSRAFNGTSSATHNNGAVIGWAVNKTDTKILVNSSAGFPTSGNYVITVDSEQMNVTAGQGTNTWTVTRGYNSTTTALHGGGEVVNTSINSSTTTITVASKSGFPTVFPFTIKVDSEYMKVTASPSGTTWTVTRGVDTARGGGSAASHNTGAAVTRIVGTADATINVSAPHSMAFPSVPFGIAVQPASGTGINSYEHMRVTAVSGSTWTVTRAQDSTAANVHTNGLTVDGTALWVPSEATVRAWIPVGFEGTDTDTPLPELNGANGTYSSNGIIQNTPLSQSINCIAAYTNGTNLATPIRMAQWYLDHYGRKGVTQGILLETDGHPQVGLESGDQTITTSEYSCQGVVNAATAAKADTTNSPDGIRIYTIGYGVDSTSKCPYSTTRLTDSNNGYNMWETATWSNKSAKLMLAAAATEPNEPYFWDNPASSELASVFRQVATDLSQGHSRLIQLYPRPIVTGVGGSSGSIDISGLYFSGATLAYVGNQPCAITSVSDTSIHCSASGSGGPYPVTVTTPGGTSFITSASYFTYP